MVKNFQQTNFFISLFFMSSSAMLLNHTGFFLRLILDYTQEVFSAKWTGTEQFPQ